MQLTIPFNNVAKSVKKNDFECNDQQLYCLCVLSQVRCDSVHRPSQPLIISEEIGRLL